MQFPKLKKVASNRPDEAEAKRLLDKESEQADKDKQEAQEDAAGLISYVDQELADAGFVMPVFTNPLDQMRYIASAVETRRTVEDIGHREKLIAGVWKFTLAWIGIVLAILFLDGYCAWGFRLDDKVLVALVTTTTANVLGLAFIILRGIFHQKAPDHTPGAGAAPTAKKSG